MLGFEAKEVSRATGRFDHDFETAPRCAWLLSVNSRDVGAV